MFKRSLVLGFLASLVALVAFATAGSAGSAPSGQRMVGNTSFDPVSGRFTGGGATIEPAFNDATGSYVYLRTPNNDQGAKNLPKKMVPFGDLGFSLPVNVAPIFLPVYPAGSNIDPSTLNCDHLVPLNPGPGTGDNCADHGSAVSAAVACINPAVYGTSLHDPGCNGFPDTNPNPTPDTSNVLGHDHLVGVAKSGGDFNILWEPVLVLFTSVDPHQARITTLAQIETAVNVTHTAFLVPLPPATFSCSVEGSAAYDKATPAPLN